MDLNTINGWYEYILKKYFRRYVFTRDYSSV